MRKTISLVLLAVLCAGLLCACNGGDTHTDTPAIKTDVTVDDLAAKVDEAIGAGDNMAARDASYIQGMMDMDVSSYAEYVVKTNAMGTNVDEYGIFKGTDEAQAAEIAQAVDAYLKMRNETWMTEYMPEERPKMEAASYEVCGVYVMYAVLADDAKTAAFDAFTGTLKA